MGGVLGSTPDVTTESEQRVREHTMPFDNECRNWAARLMHYARRSRFHRCALDRDDAEERLRRLAEDLDAKLCADRYVEESPTLQTDDGQDLLWDVVEGLREYRRLGNYDDLSPAEQELYYGTTRGQNRQEEELQAILNRLEGEAKHYFLRNADFRHVPIPPTEQMTSAFVTMADAAQEASARLSGLTYVPQRASSMVIDWSTVIA